jgi:16S rRNA U516 pseudouridylate synthase RsuA-like enzyme
MVESIGLSVQSLHRTGFANISLKGLSEGNWAELDQKEMQVIERTIAAAAVRRDEE